MTAKKTQDPTEVKEAVENNDCFIIMPIADHPDYKQGHFKRVYEDIIKPACQAAGYRAVRADDVAQTNLIHLDILQKLLESPMAICDLSTRNPNVLFELGLRQAFDKPTILIQEVGTPQIFDINLFRYTQYRNGLDYRDVIADQKAIQKVIEETKQAIADGKSVNSIIKLLSITNPANLKDTASFGEKDYFDILLNEISSIKNQISLSKDKAASNKINPFPDTYAIDFSLGTEESKISEYFDYLKSLGLIGDIRNQFINKVTNRVMSYECDARSNFKENDFRTIAPLFEVKIQDILLLPF